MLLPAQIAQNAPFEPGAIIGGLLCGLVIAVAIGTLCGAIVLRTACWLYNKLAGGTGSPSAVAEPGFGKAACISFVTTLVQFGVGVALSMAGYAAELGDITINCISLPLSLIVAAGMISGMLPTTFGRGILIALLQVGVMIAVGLVLLAIFALYLLVGFAFMKK